MTAVRKKKKTTIYSVYCFAILFAKCIWRMAKKAGNGKCTKGGQALLSLLAFLSLAGTVLFCAAWETESISWLPAVLGTSGCLLGFGMFAGLAGAFRPYQYMKKKYQHSGGRMMQIPARTIEAGKKSA